MSAPDHLMKQHDKQDITLHIQPDSPADTLPVSGNVDIRKPLQQRCEEVVEQYEKGQKDAARAAVSELFRLYPDSLRVRQLQVLIHYKDGKYTPAYTGIRAVLKLTPDNPGRLNLQGLIQRHLGLFDDAIASYQKAIMIKPDYYEPYNNLAIIYRYYGMREQAIRYFRKALQLCPKYPAAIYNLSCIKGYLPTPVEISHIEKLLPKLSKADDMARCHFALYNAYVRTKKNEIAFRHLVQGNEAIRKGFGHKKPLSLYVNEIKQTYTREYFERRPRIASFDKNPFFIVGIPRSGSSLLEQMLASHPAVYGLGESRSMLQTLAEINPSIESRVQVFMQEFSQMDAPAIQKHVEKYRSRIIGEIGGHDTYVDKMLKNFKTIGLIKILLPNARFIHIRRHPLDNCFSCYEKKFTLGHEYTYDLKVMAQYYASYTELMDYWKSLFPQDIHDVQYEKLVTDTDNTIRRCLDFMGLEMSQSCLEYYKNERRVITASTDQVREKITTDAIGKWKKFARQLQPLIDELEKTGMSGLIS